MSNTATVTVLLVEPHPDSREMYTEFLCHSGLRAIAVDNAADALARAREAQVVVTGINLRGEVDGIALVRQLKEDQPTRHTPVIVLSASALLPAREHAHRAGCDLFLSKPCLPSHLLTEILRLVTTSKDKDIERTGRPGGRGALAEPLPD